MSIFKAYRQERARHSAPESVATLYYMGEYFLDGKNWAQGVYQGAGNTRCIVGAAEHVRTSSIDDAKHWLRQAIIEHTGGAVATIEEFNDRQYSFEGVAAVLNRARQLASANLPAPVAPQRAVEIIPPARPASPWDVPRGADPDEWPDEPTPRNPDTSLRHKLADWWD